MFCKARRCVERNLNVVRRPDGSHRCVWLKGTHKVCRVPSRVAAQVTLTFATAAP